MATVGVCHCSQSWVVATCRGRRGGRAAHDGAVACDGLGGKRQCGVAHEGAGGVQRRPHIEDGPGGKRRVGWHARVQVVCGGGDAKRVVVVAGWHVTGRWHAMGQGASDRVAWHARVQVVRVVVVGSNGASNLSMWVRDMWVRGAWVRERVQARHG